MINRRYAFLVVGAILLSLKVAANAAEGSMPPGSFIPRPVTSERELASLIMEDKVVASRYSKHYGMDAAELAAYIQNNLSVSTLKQSDTYTVYFLAKKGRIKPHKKLLKAGTIVLVDFNGALIMDLSCGNPLTKTLPQPTATGVLTQLMPTTPVPTPLEVVQSIPLETQVTEQPAPEPVQAEVLAEPPRSFSFAPLLIPAVPVLLGAFNVHSSKTPIPEPQGFTVLALGAGSLITYCCRARVRSRRQKRRHR